MMTKHEAKSLFGGTDSTLAKAVGVTRSAVSQWPAKLSQRQSDLVIGAAVRLGVWKKGKPAA